MALIDTITDQGATAETVSRSVGGYRVDVTADIASVAHAWLSLEVSGVLTPYQTLGWQRAAMASLDADGQPCIVVLREPSGTVAGLLPLVIRRKKGFRIATFAGGKHANYGMGLFRPEFMASATAKQTREILKAIADRCGVDVFMFRNQPRSWANQPNPLSLLPHQASASSAWRADLQPDADAFVAGLMSSESRKKLRHKERKLGEFGPISYVEAATPGEASKLLRAFLAQKVQRFRAMGVSNPFEPPQVSAFLESAAVAPLQGGPPAPILLHGLMTGDRVAAVFGGAIHGRRYSGMFTSFDASPEIARCSPGDLLLLHLVRRMCARGLASFDLGVGDSGYKSDYCPIKEELFDSFLPMTAKGHAFALGVSAAFRVKTGLAAQKSLLAPLRALLRR